MTSNRSQSKYSMIHTTHQPSISSNILSNSIPILHSSPFSKSPLSVLLISLSLTILCIKYIFPTIKPLLTTFLARVYVYIIRHFKQSRPSRIVLMRHAQSLGNVNHHAYQHIPDHRLTLTPTGIQQAQIASHKLIQILNAPLNSSKSVLNGTVLFFTSPYLRTRQTLRELIHGMNLSESQYQIREDCRLREQDFGQLQEPDSMEFVKQQRLKVGRFWFRPTSGEAGADVYDRVSMFLDSFFRELDSFRHVVGSPGSFTYENVVIVTHGLTMRLFCMRYFRWTVEEFEEVWNPENTEMWVLEKMENDGRYKLIYPKKIWIGKDRDVNMPMNMRTPRSVSGELSQNYIQKLSLNDLDDVETNPLIRDADQELY